MSRFPSGKLVSSLAEILEPFQLDGNPINVFVPFPATTTSMNTPHSLTLVPEKDMVCVADRENGRILCFAVTDGRLQMVLKFPEFRTSLYAVAYTGTIFRKFL